MNNAQGDVMRFGSLLFVLLSLTCPYAVNAQQPPPVPPAYQDLYSQLDSDLNTFNATLGPGSGVTYPTLMTGSLKAADGNVGPQLLNSLPAVQLQLNALKAIGVKAVMVEVGFPMLYEPFLTSQGQSYTAFANYYQAVANCVREAGLKLIVENDTLLTNDERAGWNAAPFYASLNWSQYQAARAQTAVSVAQVMQPDYMVVVEEPQTEAANSGQSTANTPSGSGSLLTGILTSLQQAGVAGLKIGAGTDTAEANALAFIQQYVLLPVDFIDMHIDMVNGYYLPVALQIATTAAAAGKPVAMSECWLVKVRDSELNVLASDQLLARDPYSFWAPLDLEFIRTMENLANNTQMLFMDPFRSEYYFAYQTYGSSCYIGCPPGQSESELAALANQEGVYTSTGTGYHDSIVIPADTTPPSAPSGLIGVSPTATTVSLTWNAALDNVGVAGYYVMRNSGPVITTALQTFEYTGLVPGTYSFQVEAFDLAGNVSAPATIVLIGPDPLPPPPPSNVVVRVVACTRAILSWSPPAIPGSVTRYVILFGTSPVSLTQVASLPGTTTSYVFNGLKPATTYYIGLEAVNQIGSSPILPIAVTTPALPPPPGNLTATPNSPTSITLTWSASTGGLPIAYYIVYRGASLSSFSQLAIVTKTSYIDSNLAPSTGYYYEVVAVDTGTPPSQSGPAGPVTARTFSPPSAPILTVTPVSCSKVVLAWTPSIGGGLPIKGYRVYKGTSPSSLVLIAVTAKTSYTDSGDAGGTNYYYSVQAIDAAGDVSPLAPPVVVTTYACPCAPANLVATALSSSKVALAWSPSTGGLPIAGYMIFRGTSPSVLSKIAQTSKTSYLDVSLSAGTTYYYMVQATDTAQDYSPPSPTVAVTTPNP
jgi:fibronectin type 3 domain-containing protein